MFLYRKEKKEEEEEKIPIMNIVVLSVMVLSIVASLSAGNINKRNYGDDNVIEFVIPPNADFIQLKREIKENFEEMKAVIGSMAKCLVQIKKLDNSIKNKDSVNAIMSHVMDAQWICSGNADNAYPDEDTVLYFDNNVAKK